MARAQALEARVLLARRQRQVCMATADGLIASGLKVIEVASTDEALSSLESRSDIRLVVTEIDMPGCLRGLDLARFIMRRWPESYRLIIVTRSIGCCWRRRAWSA